MGQWRRLSSCTSLKPTWACLWQGAGLGQAAWLRLSVVSSEAVAWFLWLAEALVSPSLCADLSVCSRVTLGVSSEQPSDSTASFLSPGEGGLCLVAGRGLGNAVKATSWQVLCFCSGCSCAFRSMGAPVTWRVHLCWKGGWLILAVPSLGPFVVSPKVCLGGQRPLLLPSHLVLSSASSCMQRPGATGLLEDLEIGEPNWPVESDFLW